MVELTGECTDQIERSTTALLAVALGGGEQDIKEAQWVLPRTNQPETVLRATAEQVANLGANVLLLPAGLLHDELQRLRALARNLVRELHASREDWSGIADAVLLINTSGCIVASWTIPSCQEILELSG